MIYNTRLEAKVAGRNSVNALAIEWQAKAAEALRPFLGQDIRLQSGGLKHKVRNALPQLPEHCHYDCTSKYTLYIRCRALTQFKASHGSCTNYSEQNAPIAGTAGTGVCDQIVEWTAPRTDFTIAGVLTARAKCEAARNLLQQAERELAGFGEHDNQ